MSQPAADGIAQGVVAEGLFIVEALNEIQSVLADEPVAVAAMAPLGQVDFVEGATVEAGGKHGLDFGDGVEPFEDGVGLLAVVESAIELFTDVVREVGDFSGAHSLGVGSKVLAGIDRIMAGQNHCRVMGVTSYGVIKIQIHETGRIVWPWCSFLPSWEGGLGHCSMPDQSVDQVSGLSSCRVQALQAAVKGEILTWCGRLFLSAN